MTPQQWGVFYKGENKMAANGNSGNGNTGTATSASQAQSQAAASNAAASNAANSGNSTSGGESAAKGEASKGNANASNNATNASGLSASSAQEAAAKGNAANSNFSSGTGTFPGGIPGLGGESFSSWQSNQSSSNETYGPSNSAEAVISGLLGQPAQTTTRKGFIGAFAKDTETPAEHYSQIATQRNQALRNAYNVLKNGGTNAEAAQAYLSASPFNIGIEKGLKVSNQTYEQRDADMQALYNIGYNNNSAATTNSFAPTTINAPAAAAPAANNAPGNITGGGIAGSSTETAAAPSVSDATNTGFTYRGGTVTNGGTSVTDSGTGGSISSNAPSRDASSIGLGVYNTDRANYDQDNWNRGMEVESSSLVSDEECKAFAKRAFMENSEPFKKCRVTIIKKC